MCPGEASRGSNLQDILRLLTLWFSHGAAPDVEKALEEGFQHVSIDTWLVVIPQASSNNQRGCLQATPVPHMQSAGKQAVLHVAQVIARIHTTQAVVRRLIHSLLICIGRHHPQALMYPLLVACKSQSSFRRSAAMHVVDNVRQHSATLVEQAQLVRMRPVKQAPVVAHLTYASLQVHQRESLDNTMSSCRH